MNKIVLCFFLGLVMVFSGCSSSGPGGDEFLYTVSKKDFVNTLTVPGILEAKKTYTVACQRLRTDATISYLIPEGTLVQKGDTVCLLEAKEIENSYLEAVRELENARAEYNKSVADLRLQYLLLESQVRVIESTTAIKKLDSLQMRFSSPVKRRLIELELQKAAIEKHKINKKLEFLKKINKSELRKMEMKIRQAKNRVDREKEELNKLILTSGAEGVVMYAKLWTSGSKVREGDIVWGRMPIIQIPDLSQMQVMLNVNETSYKKIQKGQSVICSVDAFPEIQMKGEISKKAPVGKPINKGSRVKMFDITVKLDTVDLSLNPGLGVTCDVVIEKLNDTIVAPLVSVFETDSSKIVYMKKDEQFIQKTVETGPESLTDIVISHGLKPQDIISLKEPVHDKIRMEQ